MDTYEYYEYQEDELQALRDRGLTLIGGRGIDLYCRVWLTVDVDGQRFVVKSMPNNSGELDIHLRLSKMQSPRNHTIPAEFIRCTQTALAVMPRLQDLINICNRDLQIGAMFDVVDSILEGVQFLHEQKIAHIDIDMANTLYSNETSSNPFAVVANSLFLIDFGSSQNLHVGPGEGALVTFFRTGGAHFEPPEGLELVDPYAFDIYSLGKSLSRFTAAARGQSKGRIHISTCIWLYYRLLADASPNRRPSIWRARRLFHALRIWINATGWLRSILNEHASDAIMSSGWRILSNMIP